MIFGAILALVKVGQSKAENMHFLSIFSELSFESGFRYQFERYAWTPVFMRFGAILSLVQGWSNQGLKDALLPTFSELSFESGFRYPFER